MKIAHHIISTESIIGIGPLMVKRTTDITMLQIYGTQKLYFEIHCRERSIEISSDWYDVSGHNDDAIRAYNKIKTDFKMDYDKAFQKIAALLSEDVSQA